MGDLRDSLKQEAQAQLRNLCDLLNDYQQPERRDAFRSLVKRLMDAPDLLHMLARDRVLRDALSKAWKPAFEPIAGGKGAIWTVNQIPVRVGQSLEYHPAVSGPLRAKPKTWAIRHFALLVLNPLCHHLRGPCKRPTCARYYIKKRETKHYCSKSCGKLKRKEQSTAAERDALLKSAAKFWPQWTERKHPNRSFWIAGRVNGSHVRVRTKTGSKPVRVITGKWISRNRVAIQRAAATLAGIPPG